MVFFLFVNIEKRLPPIAHRLNSLPPPTLCFQTRSHVCQLMSNRISHVTSVMMFFIRSCSDVSTIKDTESIACR